MSIDRRCALLVLIVLASATACSTNSTNSTSATIGDSPSATISSTTVATIGSTTVDTSSSTADLGRLSGHLYRVGGPAPGAPHPFAGTIRVTGNLFSRDITIAADGVYSVAVPPGRYTVVGHSPKFNDGTMSCPGANSAQVSAHHTTVLNAICQLK